MLTIRFNTSYSKGKQIVSDDDKLNSVFKIIDLFKEKNLCFAYDKATLPIEVSNQILKLYTFTHVKKLAKFEFILTDLFTQCLNNEQLAKFLSTGKESEEGEEIIKQNNELYLFEFEFDDVNDTKYLVIKMFKRNSQSLKMSDEKLMTDPGSVIEFIALFDETFKVIQGNDTVNAHQFLNKRKCVIL